MPEVNYLLSVSWGYIKVCLWVINRRTLECTGCLKWRLLEFLPLLGLEMEKSRNIYTV